jgi:hypothetical protein
MDKLAQLREQAKTRFMRDPEKLKGVKERARTAAKKTMLERKVMTESEIDAIEAEEE